jgi:ketosteroid isomerase-like protein
VAQVLGIRPNAVAETLATYTGILRIRDGQISRIEYFSDHDQALIAMGLEE